MALALLPQLKNLLGVAGGDSSQDAQLQAFLDAASAAVKAHCRRDLEQASYQEYHSGNGTARIALRQRPVTAVAEVRLDDGGAFGQAPGGFPAQTVLANGTDYVLDWDKGQASSTSGILWRINSVWPMRWQSSGWRRLSPEAGPSMGNISVSYTAGFAAIPADLSFACCLLATAMRRDMPYGGRFLGSERIGDYSYRISQASLADTEIGTVKSILSRYRESGW